MAENSIARLGGLGVAAGGGGAFSVGPSDLDALRHYIDIQEEHHRTRTFQEEYRAFLTKYGVEFDERYGWD